MQHSVHHTYTTMIYLTQEKTMQTIKEIIPNFKNVEHFSDSCASQYKNKSFHNLCMHNQDYGVQATWSFLATIHGKSPCDGHCKMSTAMESKSAIACRWPNLDCWSMLAYCNQNLSNIQFVNPLKKDLIDAEKSYNQDFKYLHQVGHTRISPLHGNVIN